MVGPRHAKKKSSCKWGQHPRRLIRALHCPLTELLNTIDYMSGEKRPRWNLVHAHAHGDLNLRILHMFEGIFSLDAAQFLLLSLSVTLVGQSGETFRGFLIQVVTAQDTVVGSMAPTSGPPALANIQCGSNVSSIEGDRPKKHTTSQRRRYNVATSRRCSDVVTTLLGCCVFAGRYIAKEGNSDIEIFAAATLKGNNLLPKFILLRAEPPFGKDSTITEDTASPLLKLSPYIKCQQWFS